MENFRVQKCCSKCKKEKSISEFYAGHCWCKKCQKEHVMAKRAQNLESYKGYLKRIWTRPSIIYSHKRANAKKDGVKFTLKKESFIEWYELQAKCCTYCGIKPELFKRTNDKLLSNQVNLGIDRINPNKGYIQGNITLSCRRCNSIKNDFFTSEEMKELAQKYVIPKWNALGLLKCVT